MKILYVSFSLICLCLLSNIGFAQKNPQYPGMTVVKKQESATKATYTIKKWNREFQVALTRTPQAVDVQMFGPRGAVIGLGKIGKEGNSGRKLVLRKSAKGLVAFWQFSLDRVSIQNGQINLMPIQQEGNAQWTCEYCCYETHLLSEGYILRDEEYAQEQMDQGKPPKEWGWIYTLPPSSLLEAYNDCVDSCNQGGECSDYEW